MPQSGLMFSQQSNTLNTYNHSLKPTHIVIREASGVLMDCTKAAGFTIFVVEFSKTQKPLSPGSDDGFAKWKTPKALLAQNQNRSQSVKPKPLNGMFSLIVL